MPGYVFVTSACLSCGRLFSYNPHLVPSSSAITGKREPICPNCMGAINAKRRQMGLEPFPIMEGAYDAMPEEQL